MVLKQYKKAQRLAIDTSKWRVQKEWMKKEQKSLVIKGVGAL